MEYIAIAAVGADPELFFQTPEGMPMSAERLIPGTKSNPSPMTGLPAGYFIQVDNVAAEYNIPPSMSASSFAKATYEGYLYVLAQAEKHGLKGLVVPDLDFPDWQLATPHAQELGCDPDFNIWALKPNPRPKPPKAMRTAAGHVHVSWNMPDEEQRILMGRSLDVYLGLPSILVTQPSRRRQLYGKAGAVRMKPYGIEYRTLDNFWICNQKYAQQIFRNVCRAADWLNSQPLAGRLLEEYSESVQQCINTHDMVLAHDLVDVFRVSRF